MNNEEKRKAVLTAYERTYGQGKAVPVTQIAQAAGVVHGCAKAVLDRAGLPYQTFGRNQHTCAGKSETPGKRTAAQARFNTHQVTGGEIRAKRREEVQRNGGKGPKGQRAGAGYPPGAVIREACAMCSARMVICPATYPHYIRCEDGTVAWICSGCDSVYA